MYTKPGSDTAPQIMYAAMAFSYLGAMLASNHALQFVSYPTQVRLEPCKTAINYDWTRDAPMNQEISISYFNYYYFERLDRPINMYPFTMNRPMMKP